MLSPMARSHPFFYGVKGTETFDQRLKSKDLELAVGRKQGAHPCHRMRQSGHWPSPLMGTEKGC